MKLLNCQMILLMCLLFRISLCCEAKKNIPVSKKSTLKEICLEVVAFCSSEQINAKSGLSVDVLPEELKESLQKLVTIHTGNIASVLKINQTYNNKLIQTQCEQFINQSSFTTKLRIETNLRNKGFENNEIYRFIPSRSFKRPNAVNVKSLIYQYYLKKR